MSDADSAQAQTIVRAKMDSALLGHGSDWWNGAMLVSLALAAFIAFPVAMATAGVIVVQKREAVAAAERIASLEKETADARLEAERIKKEVAWRELNADTRAKLIAGLSTKPTSVTLVFVSGDAEATEYCAQFVSAFKQAGWKVQIVGRTFLGPPVGIFVTNNDIWNVEMQADIDHVRKVFFDAGVPVGKGAGAVESRIPGLSLGKATARVRVVVGHRPPPKLE
jgi:hypothetical protein